jgi:NADH-quinone oxidoreductase subunit I
MLGIGIIKGMAVTAKNFFGSFVSKKWLPTVQYPEAGNTITAFSRNIPFLVYDKEDSPLETMRCVACKICEKECPPQCIYIVQEKDANGKLLKRPRIFDIDISVCMGCQICVEMCPFESIKMDSVFELSSENRFEGLLLHRENLLKSNSYYHQIHPQEAQEVDDRLAAKQKKAAATAAATTPSTPAP